MVVLGIIAFAITVLDAWGWWQWKSIARQLSIEAEGGAVRIAESALISLPSVVERTRRMAPNDLGMASRERAIQALSRVGRLQVAWQPTSPIGYTNLAREALLLDQIETATEAVQRAIERDPTSPYLHRLNALISLFVGDLDSALAELSIAEAIAPGMQSPRVELAPESERHVRIEGLRLRSDYYPRRKTETALALAREIRRDGDPEGARLELVGFEQHPSVIIELATWEIQEGAFAAALERLRTVTGQTAYPRSIRARAWTLVAVARDSEGDGEGAQEAANTALGLDPSSTAPYVTLAGLAQSRGDFEGALSHLRKAWGMSPSDSNLLVRIAVVAEQAGKQADALLALGRAVEINPEAPGLWSRFVALQIRTGHLSEAAMTLSQALDRFPTDTVLLRQAEQLRRDVGVR
jgi:tetratricopeptide (TPR) repeat protein